MNDLNLKIHICPETKKFTKLEEKLYFPNSGEEVLCLTKSREYKILTFSFMHSSFKSNENGDMIRDGKGENYWINENGNEEYCNNESGNEIIAWYRLYE